MIVPGLAGNDNEIRDLVDKNCYMAIYAGPNINNQAPYNAVVDTSIYENNFTPASWGLFGPTMIWYRGGEFSCFVRYVPLADRNSVWGIGGYPYPGWEIIHYHNPTGVIGQFGVWAVGALDAFSADSGYGAAGLFQTAGFTWRGSDDRFSGYKDGVVGSRDQLAVGTPAWTQFGGSATNVNADVWKVACIDGGQHTTYLSHIYMWDRELQHRDMLRLAANPMAIFTAPHPTLWMAGIDLPTPPVEPPAPTTGSPGQQHILGST